MEMGTTAPSVLCSALTGCENSSAMRWRRVSAWPVRAAAGMGSGSACSGTCKAGGWRLAFGARAIGAGGAASWIPWAGGAASWITGAGGS